MGCVKNYDTDMELNVIEPEVQGPEQEELLPEEAAMLNPVFDDSELAADDSLRQYLNEIGTYPLLSQEEELALAQKKCGGDEAAAHMLVNCNLRLVVSIARHYVGHGISFMDLIQEGNLGLMRGVEKYDPTQGSRISTYVSWWIRQSMSRAIAENGRVIRLPVHVLEAVNHARQLQREALQTLGRPLTEEELAKKLGLKLSRLKAILKAGADTISLESPAGEGEDSVLGDFVADDRFSNPEEQTEKTMLQEQVRNALKVLNEKERFVVMERYGFADDCPATLEEVGKKLSITRERVRQIERVAMQKLARSTRFQQLSAYLAG